MWRLENSSKELKRITLSYAEETMKRTPFKICYKKK